MNDEASRVSVKTIALWIVAIGVGGLVAYLGVLAFSNSLARTLSEIAAGKVRTELSGFALGVVQSFRSVIMYVGITWAIVMVVALLRRQMPQQAIARGWIIVLAISVAIKLLGEFLLNPGLFLEIVSGGLQKGFLYALIALGYTMIYGVVKLINFAHGDIFMVGAFVSFYTISSLEVHHLPGVLYVRLSGAAEAPQWLLAIGGFLVILASMATSALLAVVIERVAYKPLRDAPRIAALITAVGVSFFLEYFSALDFSFGPDFVTYNRPFPLVRWDNTNMNAVLLFIFVALLLFGGLGQLILWVLERRMTRVPEILHSAFLRLLIRFSLLAGGFGGLYMGLILL